MLRLTEEDIETLAYDLQHDEIEAVYGKEAAAQANYGWGVDGDSYGTSIATKVYGHGVLSTWIDWNRGTIDHKWQWQ